MINIFDIARTAGVSKTTVSRVINNQPGVREDTRIKVLEAIEKLNYIPNQAARSLVSRKAGVIGVIYNEFNNSVYLKLANLLEKCASRYNYNMVFSSSNDDFNSKVRYIQYFTGGAADGLILFGSDTRDKELVQKVINTKFPLVVIENHFNDLKVNDIIIDNFSGAKKAVDYLIGLGHRKIAHITGNLNHRVASDRMNGYIEALNSAGIKYNKDYVIYTDAGENTGASAMEKLYGIPEPPTALFTFNDLQGYEAIQKAIELGLNIPKELSIVGFDNIYELLRFIPSNIRLASMKQPMEKVAEAAIELITENITDKNTEPKVLTFDTELYPGTSCSKASD
ncbi:MAG: transcriptional regulator [Eubacterium sp.]|nr:transcriptional regulator [Eubacterium sp.]